MITDILKYGLGFVFLLLLQTLVLNHLQLSIYINPYLYIFFIIALPFNTPNWLLLTLAFVMGLMVDLFTGTLGMHASALVFMAFCRRYLLSVIAPREGYEFGSRPHYQDMGMTWFLIYSSVLTLCHHLFLFFVEAFEFHSFFIILFRVILSSLFTLLLIWMAQVFTYKKHG